MQRPFAKLAVGSGADEKLGILAERSGLGGMMFLLSIAEAYPYGILPGSPRAYRAAVLPSAMISEEEVEKAIDAQVETGLIARYKGDGHELLYVLNYHRYQDVAWSKVRPSPHPLPPQWRVPDALQVMIDEGTLTRSKKQFGEYGVMGLSDTESEAPDELPPGAPPVPTSAPPVPTGASAVPEAPHRHPEAPGRHSTATATSTAVNGVQEEGTSRGKRLGETGDLPYMKLEYGNLYAACQKLPWTGDIPLRWFEDIIAAIESESDAWIDDDFQAAELLRQYPPKGAEKNLPSKWLERVEREVAAQQPTPRSSYEAALAEVEALANARFADLPEPAPTVSEGGARDE